MAAEDVEPGEPSSPRILQVLAHDLIGGTELLVQMHAERLNRAGLPTDVAILDAPGPVTRELRARGVRVEPLGGGRLGLLRASMRLARLLRRSGYALVEAYGFKASLISRLLASTLRPRPLQVCGVMGRHITEVVELDEAKGRFALWVERRTARLVDAYDVINRAAIEMLAAEGIPRDRMHYIPNGIDLDRWPMRDERARPDGTPTVLMNARFVPRKRHDDLIRAAAHLDERGVACRVLLAGEGPTLGAMRELARELGVDGRVEFLGAVPPSEVMELMETASVFCLPSLWEGIPAAVLEAMARGVPVVATDVDGIHDLVQDGTSGRLVPAKAPHRLAEALDEVIADPEAAAGLAEVARGVVEREYRIERVVERKRRLYGELLAAAGR